MDAKIQKKSKPSKLTNVYVDVSNDEKESIKLFFSLRGMQKSFLDQHKNHLRRHLNAAMYSGSYRIELLTDVRRFIEEHKDEVAEFLKTDAA